MRFAAIAAGAKMRERREKLCVTQRELAALSDVALPTVGNYERGVLPHKNESGALRRVLVSLDELEALQRQPESVQ